jgi:uncharacterized protein YecE (DUF72 family)
MYELISAFANEKRTNYDKLSVRAAKLLSHRIMRPLAQGQRCRQSGAGMNVFVGTSDYSYKEWKGKFYPQDLPAKQMLSYYGERFGAVEINGSFYRMPTASTLAGWASEVPAGFQFAFKAPQQITHFKRLKGAEELTAQFCEVTAVLKKRLGPLLFGLPPNMKKDAARLKAFLKLLPRKLRVAFEFRHASWFDDEVFSLLKARNVALCIAEAENSVEVPFVATADWGYARLRLPEYSGAALKAWKKRLLNQDWKDTFVFFKHEDEGKGPRFARKFVDLA